MNLAVAANVLIVVPVTNPDNALHIMILAMHVARKDIGSLVADQ